MSTAYNERTVEWYRPALLGRMALVWMVGVMLIGFGMLASGIAFDPTGRFPEELQFACLILGVLGTVGGALFGLLGILRLLATDPVWLLLRLDGVVFHDHSQEVKVQWSALKAVRWEDRSLKLVREDGPEVVIEYTFMGISGPDLAKRIVEIQRQALMGVLQQRMP